MFVKLREPVNGLMHLGAAIAAGFGLVALLVIGRDSLPKQASLLIYGAALILMFSASAAYHLIPAQPQGALVLRKLDHSAIYLLIAGTYTPICIHFFSGFWRWGVLAIIWSMAIVGVIVKVFVDPSATLVDHRDLSGDGLAVSDGDPGDARHDAHERADLAAPGRHLLLARCDRLRHQTAEPSIRASSGSTSSGTSSSSSAVCATSSWWLPMSRRPPCEPEGLSARSSAPAGTSGKTCVIAYAFARHLADGAAAAWTVLTRFASARPGSRVPRTSMASPNPHQQRVDRFGQHRSHRRVEPGNSSAARLARRLNG